MAVQAVLLGILGERRRVARAEHILQHLMLRGGRPWRDLDGGDCVRRRAFFLPARVRRGGRWRRGRRGRGHGPERELGKVVHDAVLAHGIEGLVAARAVKRHEAEAAEAIRTRQVGVRVRHGATRHVGPHAVGIARGDDPSVRLESRLGEAPRDDELHPRRERLAIEGWRQRDDCARRRELPHVAHHVDDVGRLGVRRRDPHKLGWQKSRRRVESNAAHARVGSERIVGVQAHERVIRPVFAHEMRHGWNPLRHAPGRLALDSIGRGAALRRRRRRLRGRHATNCQTLVQP